MFTKGPNKRLLETSEEHWVIGKGKSLKEAIYDLKKNERKKYEIPVVLRRNGYGVAAWSR